MVVGYTKTNNLRAYSAVGRNYRVHKRSGFGGVEGVACEIALCVITPRIIQFANKPEQGANSSTKVFDEMQCG